MEEPRDDVAAAEAARAQAEARRKRILEKADKRMGAVSGEQTQDGDEKEESASKAARIRAARQRRYRKKTASSSDDAIPAQITPPESKPSDIPQKVESGAENENNSIEVSASMESTDEKSRQESGVIEASKISESSTRLAEEMPKKKYMGVARMRRNMLKKKKEEEKATKSESVDLQSASTKTSSIPAPAFSKTLLPIYMHIVTVFLLFFAGLNVGWQQPLHKASQIESQHSLMQNGLPLINRPMQSTPTSSFQSSGTGSIGETVLANEDSSSFDEFQDDETEDVSNIDPLFRVDLDQLTEGPGVMNALARRAISVHRLILCVLYYGPINVLQALTAIPQALLRFPPSLCLIGLTIRQFIGKSILGAEIPELDNSNDKAGTIDIVAMAKNFVSTFFTSNFPTVFGMYDAFNHLRADMYIMLCGVFTGLVWVHLLGSEPTLDGKLINEEL